MGVFGKVPRSYQQAEKSIDSDLWLAAADILRENYTAPLLNLHLDAISYLWSPTYPKKLMTEALVIPFTQNFVKLEAWDPINKPWQRLADDSPITTQFVSSL